MTGKSVFRASVLTGIFACVAMVLCGSIAVSADNVSECSTSPCSGSTTFNVNIHEVLGVSITVPDTWASGDTGDFLRNAIGLRVTSNNGAGFTASMRTKTSTTALTNAANSDYTIATLSSNVAKSSFDSNRWGYSLGDYTAANSSDTSVPETSAGDNSSIYKPMSSTATTILYSATAASDSQDIYFGAKADASSAAGTYYNTVVISVVSGVVTSDNGDNPINPADPATPDDTSNGSPTYDQDSGRTVYTTASTSGSGSSSTTTTATEVSSGDTTSSYADPAGVTTKTSSNLDGGTPLATGLAVTAGIAAVTGVVFLVAAKRRDNDDDNNYE